MSTPLSYDEARELLPAYVLGALDEQERAIVQSYLDRYPELRAEAAKYGAVTHGLATSVPQRTPPASLKVALMAKTQPPHAAPSRWQRWMDALRDSTLALRLAIAAVILGTAIAVVQVARMSPTDLEKIAQQQRVSAILDNSTEMVHLDGTQQAPDAWAVVRYNPGERVAAMRVGDLPSLPATQAYQLWLVDGSGKRWSGAVFNTSASGQSLVLVNCPQPMESIVRYGVSIEPAGGSPGPTGPAALRS